MDYRVNPMLLVYPAEINGCRRLIAELSAGNPPLLLNEPKIAWALASLPNRFTKEDAVDRWADAFEGDIPFLLWDLFGN